MITVPALLVFFIVTGAAAVAAIALGMQLGEWTGDQWWKHKMRKHNRFMDK